MTRSGAGRKHPGVLREHLAPYKRIKRLEFSDLPKTISGKIRRVELRKAEEERHRGESMSGVEYRDSDFPAVKSQSS